MGVPRLSYEVYAHSDILIINPVGIMYDEATKENLSKFRLPSSSTAFGAVLYQYFENNLQQALPAQGRLRFAQQKLEESVQLASSLRQEHIDKQVAHFVADYETFGLPKGNLFAEAQFTDVQRESIARQYVHHEFGERLAQPARKVPVVYDMLQTAEEKQALRAAIRDHVTKYEQLRKQPETPELVRSKLEEFEYDFAQLLRKEEQ